MKIEKNKVASLSYELEVEGKIADKAGADKPLDYIHGTGMLLPKFEEAVEGKEPGESFEFTLSPADGYGEYSPEYKVEIPKQSFAGPDGVIREDLLVPGTIVPMLNGSGQVIQGTVAEVGAETVTMDFNHPMAGKTLHFTGKVEAVREATEEELREGLHHCGHCGNCHGDGECEGGCHGDGECHGEGDCHKEGGCHCKEK